MTTKPLRHERRINGAAVFAIRKARHPFTQAQLATACGVNDKGEPLSYATISRVETAGLQPSLEIMCRIANGLGVPLDAITYVTAVYVPDELARPVGVVCDQDGQAVA